MAAKLTRKRCASAFLDEPVPAPPQFAKRGRFSPAPAAFAVQQQEEEEAAAFRVESAAVRSDGGIEECAGVLVEQMFAAADAADARSRAAGILKLIEAVFARRAAAAAASEAAALREENGALRARVEALELDNDVLKRSVAEQHLRQAVMERDNGVLKHGVATLHRREEEAQRAAAEMKKKVAELEAC